MDILVAYDVNTQTREGRRRLRRVARICTAYGQRVQNSVFECSLNQAKFEELETSLLGVIDQEKDSLRIYFLYGSRDRYMRAYGRDHYVDFDAPLVL